MGNSIDLAAKAEHIEYLNDVAAFTRQQLDVTTKNDFGMTLHGEMEYCDIFGTYHCQTFGVVYRPSFNTFVAEIGGDESSCSEGTLESDFGEKMKAQGFHEIDRCEQPDEAEEHGHH